jgi:hypothetical protein
LSEINIEFGGRLDWMADVYRLNTTLHLASERVIDIISARDPDALEVAPVNFKTPTGERIGGYRVVMPCRVLDAIDVPKTDISVTRPDRAQGLDMPITHVSYDNGRVWQQHWVAMEQ